MKYTKYLLVLSIVLTVFAIGFMFSQSARPVGASTFQGQDYMGTTTDQTWTTLVPKVLKSQGGALGTVSVTTVGTGSLTFYDATTTNVNLRTNNTATSTIVLANFQITTSLGSYTFDRTFNDGLIVVWTGTNNASTSIMWR